MSGADMTLFYSVTMIRETRGKQSSGNSWVVFCKMKHSFLMPRKQREPCACWQLHSHSEESEGPSRPEGLLLAFNQVHLKGPEDPKTAFRELK